MLDYLIVVAKHSRTIIYTSLAVTALTYLILLCLPNKYTATARLLPPQQNFTLSAQLLDELGARNLPMGNRGSSLANLLGGRTPGDLYVGMLKGSTISDQIIDLFKLRKLYDEKKIEDVRRVLGKRTSFKATKAGIITVQVTDKSPKRAAKMANAYIKGLDKLLQRMAREEATERLAFLEKELHQTSANLSKAEDALRTFSEKSSVLQIDAQTRSILEYIATLRATIDSKEVQLMVLKQQATPMNYDLIRIKTEIKGLKDKLSAAEAQGAKNLCSGETMLATNKVPSLGLEYMRYFREVKFQEGQYQLYSKMVELARMDQVRTASVIHVVDWALPPEKKSNQRGVRALQVGALTFFTMIFVAFVQEYWSQARIEEEKSGRLALLSQYLEPWLRPIKRVASLFHRKKPHI